MPPCLMRSSVTCASSGSLRAVSTTRAPLDAASLAVLSPMPLDAPVMTMVCLPICFMKERWCNRRAGGRCAAIVGVPRPERRGFFALPLAWLVAIDRASPVVACRDVGRRVRADAGGDAGRGGQAEEAGQWCAIELVEPFGSAFRQGERGRRERGEGRSRAGPTGVAHRAGSRGIDRLDE